MKATKTVIIALVLALAAAAGASPLIGVSGDHDLDALWARAQRTHDLARADAVLLLESRRVDIGADGAVATRVHRVVWIATSLGIRHHADLRVPWNEATSRLEVHKLRTWRDGRWWPDAERLSETAVVHTLPYAVDHADAYTTMRETMLLHDGVELPCIMETEYTVTERGLPAADDLFVLPQRDPALRVELTVSAPLGAPLHRVELNGAPPAAASEAGGRRTLTWVLEPAPALRLPVAGQPAAYEPTVAWSTWEDWGAVSTDLRDRILRGAPLDAELQARVDETLDNLPSWPGKARALAKLIDDSVRPIRYDSRYWRQAPRTSREVWDSAYGHAADRAVLAKGLFEAAGFTVVAVQLALAGDVLPSDPAFPGPARYTHLVLDVASRGETFHGLYDPDTGRLTPGRDYGNRPYLADGVVRQGEMAVARSETSHRFVLDLTIDTVAAEAWSGTGYLEAQLLMAPYAEMAGLGDEARSYLQDVAGRVLPGAEVGEHSVHSFTDGFIAAGFGFTLPAPAAGGSLVVGSPFPGPWYDLPGDLALEQERRSSPMVVGSGNLVVRLRLPREGARLAWSPPDHVVEHGGADGGRGVGSFAVSTTVRGDQLVYERRLSLPYHPFLAASAWPRLRELLLEEGDTANRTLVLDKAAD